MSNLSPTASSLPEAKSVPHKTALSVLIPTKNEERNLADCLASVSWVDDVVVLDSLSEDQTCAIAKRGGARVVSRAFDNFSTHKNWALDQVEFKHEWVFLLDADERATPELEEEIGRLLRANPSENGFYIARQNWFAGKWVRHGGWYPNWNLRLLRRGFGRYEERIVHEHMIVQGSVGFLKNPLVHYDYKGIERYFDRHNMYSSMEAVEVFRTLHRSTSSNQLPPTLLAKGPGRRRFLKELAYRYLPARSVIKFLWMYVFQLGFLDGRIGFCYCVLHMFYEYQVSLKLEELKSTDSALYKKYRDLLEG